MQITCAERDVYHVRGVVLARYSSGSLLYGRSDCVANDDDNVDNDDGGGG